MNETYRVELAAPGSVVVRIARQPVPWFTDEEHIMAQADFEKAYADLERAVGRELPRAGEARAVRAERHE